MALINTSPLEASEQDVALGVINEEAFGSNTSVNISEKKEFISTYITSTKFRKLVVFQHLKAEMFAADGRLLPINIWLDTGAATTFIREDLASSLGLEGEVLTLSLRGCRSMKTEDISSQRIKLKIKTTIGEFLMKALTLSQIMGPFPVLNWNQLRLHWKHLSDLPLTESGGVMNIHIGLDNAHLMTALESRVAGPDVPIASLTALGWVPSGVITKNILLKLFASKANTTTNTRYSSAITVQQKTNTFSHSVQSL